MCGVFGFWLNRSLTPDDLGLGRMALSMLAHRGPDGEGEWFDKEKGIYLGHRRLAIIDTTELSSQPINIGEHVLSFNGEIYNFLELRKKLEYEGVTFRSEGDGEVLLQAWRQWGDKALDSFDGMYAFALYDGVQIHLVTDPFGEKPLFVLQASDGVYFSSEAHVLIDLFKLEFTPDESDIAAFMCLGFIPEGKTGFDKLTALTPANHYRIRNGSINDSCCYWSQPETSVGNGNVKELNESELDSIHEVLLESLSLRMRADVPVGVFLSGGVDSALVASMVAKDLDIQVKTLTVAYPDGVDESPEAARIAAHLGLPHVVVDSSDDGLWKNAPQQLKRMYGSPNDNMTALSVYQLSTLARKHMTVALSGTGGDELFYGYNKYHFLYKNRNAYRWLSPVVNTLAFLDPLLGSVKQWQMAIKYLRGSSDWQYLSLKNNGQGQLLREVTDKSFWQGYLLSAEGRDLALRVRDFDITKTLPGSYIPAIDRGSMRASLEVRTPFLSRKLLETVCQMDQRSFLAYGQKEVLRKILARYIPRNLTDLPKRGFVFPAERFLAQERLSRPEIPWCPHFVVEEIWQNRMNSEYRGLALRAAILSKFASLSKDS